MATVVGYSLNLILRAAFASQSLDDGKFKVGKKNQQKEAAAVAEMSREAAQQVCL